MTEAGEASSPGMASDRVVRRLLLGIFLILTIYALYFARDFFLPVLLAFLLALTLSPIVRFLDRRGIAPALSATILVVASFSTLAVAGYLLSGPVVQMVTDAPSIGRELNERLSHLKAPLSRFMEASEEIEQVAEAGQEPGVQRVVVSQPGIVSRAASNLISAATTIAITFVLSLFLLASGSLFYQKIVQSFDLMSDKKRALRVVYDVEREISRYLLTVAIINICLGLCVGIGCLLLGMPNPLLWGVAAALLNFLPYVGSLIGIVLVGAIAIVTFDSLGYALLVPTMYIFFTVIEGQFITPLVVGRRLELNAVAVFIAIAFWSWLWGFAGALLAVPILVLVKVFCDHFDGLRHVGNFLAADQNNGATETATAET